MYNIKVINQCIPDKIFNESCFNSVYDAKFKLNNTLYIPTELKDGVFCCNGTSKENLEVIVNLKSYLSGKKYKEGIDYTISVLIEN